METGRHLTYIFHSGRPGKKNTGQTSGSAGNLQSEIPILYQNDLNTRDEWLLHIYCPYSGRCPTGLWNAYVKVGGSTFHKGIRIETIKPNRLKITLALPRILQATDKEVYAPLTSAWLTGAKASHLKTKVEMSLSKVNTQFKNYGQYIFNNPATDFTTIKTNMFDGMLSAEGRAGVTLNSLQQPMRRVC